jgi:hypothetical protein
MLKKSSPLKQLGQMEPNLAGSIFVRSKPGIDGPWVCPFQNCVRQPHPPFKMAAVFKVMIISLWNLLQYHSIVRWAIQAQWAEPLVCNLQSRARTQAILVIVLYELLGNTTTLLIEPPGPLNNNNTVS